MENTSQKNGSTRSVCGGRPLESGRRNENSTENSWCSKCSILELPDDVLYIIFKFFSPESLCTVSKVCRRFRLLASEDSVWMRHERERTVLRLNHSRNILSFLGLKERYRVALNWEMGHRREAWLLRHNYRLLPWLQKEDNTLWMSSGSLIHKFGIKSNGLPREQAEGHLYGLDSDVTRFVVKNGLVVSGCRGGSLSVWEASSCMKLQHFAKIHSSDTQCVDVIDDFIVSGSKDKTIKIVSMLHDDDMRIRKSRHIGDRVWSLSVSPNRSTLAVGTACYNNPPIFLWDLNRGEPVGYLGDGHKRGAGVLDMCFESPNILLTCGHDTYLRMWDLRTRGCVGQWEDQFDSAVYCLQTDGQYTLLTGTARHGVVRLWDKRQTNHVQVYYTGNQSSPVYSLACDVHHLFVALDLGLTLVDFSIR